MGKNDGCKVEDVEEGEISDTASVEEISEQDFKKQEEEAEVVVVKETKPKDSRVWTMRDLYKYQLSGGYVSGLYNLAWAQAVQNKPLNELFVEVVEADENSKKSSPSSSVASSVNSNGRDEKKVVEKVVIDDSGDEIEEGELEEGEIDLDSEPAKLAAAGEVDNEEMNVDKTVKLIRDALESVSVVEAEQSFGAVCSKLQSTLESLQKVVQLNNVSTNDALVQLLFTAVRSVNSVFGSMSPELKEQNKEIFSRFLHNVNIHDPPLFSPEQIKEIAVIISSLDSVDVLLSARYGEKEKETQLLGELNKKDNDALDKNAGHDLNTANKLFSSADYFPHNKPNMTLEALKTGASSFKSRGVQLPLLDLHKDHDADSLPSPTRETAPSLPLHRVMTVGDGIKSGLPTAKTMPNTKETKMHPYETDALKAVSSYQQKFGRSSFFMTDRLPSPTPSEESADGDVDTAGEVSSLSTAGEVSSLSTAGNARTVNPPILPQQIASPSPRPDSSTLLGVIPARCSTQLSSASTSTAKATAKSRDPRLRYVNPDFSALDQSQIALPTVNNTPKVESVGTMVGSRKQKTVEDPIMDGPTLKKPRHLIQNSGIVRDLKNLTGSGGWLEDTDMVGPQTMKRNQLAEIAESDPRPIGNGLPCSNPAIGQPNVSFRANEQIPITGTSTISVGEQTPVTGTSTTSLPDLLKDIAVNPAMLINLIKMGQQQRLALEAQKKPDPAKSTTHAPSLNSNSIIGALPPVNVTPPQSTGILPRPAGTVQAPSQMTAVDDLGKIRMKPRDPRRVLHNNTIQRTGSMSSEQLKTNVAPMSGTQGNRDNQNVQKQDDQAEMKSVPSQSLVPPDISLPFTKSLMNIADIMSVSQAPTTSSLVSQNITSQPLQIKSDRADAKPIITSSELQTGAGSVPEERPAGSCPQNAWGDVEHLFEGYDDKQKAAIQRERARRIEEQKKMFAARKLCLVLDLDHTLLNSAKFVEVDPVHDEILRKKEEQDREKPYRHLFRFPYMGMWTKLRPGIWNFLEKASKLYELHLYTMGNKLYATEMAKVLDPKGVLFNGRVISKGDDGDYFDGDERVPKSKDLEGVLGMESAVVIIDDSVRVWPHNKLNLIVVERYIYFPCSRRQFGLPGPSLLEIDHDERPEDGTLASSLAVIERIHQNFFTHQSLDDADVRNILASEQRKILAGCRIVFSRVFPVGEANPQLHPLWQTAEQFGAVCTNQVDEQVTHVVANSLGTDKVNWALTNGRFVVHPGWVEASALLYRRANELDFAIKL